MTVVRRIAMLFVCLTIIGCQLKEDKGGSTDGGPPPIPAPADVAAPPADALKTPSGIASKVLRVGLGSIRPGPRSTVRVHYTGWTTDGKMFDSSSSRGKPVEFTVDMVIDGWKEGLQLMVVGEQRRFWIPGRLGYDNIPDQPGFPPSPKGMLVFDIELLDVR